MNNASLRAPSLLKEKLFCCQALKGHSLLLKSHIAPLPLQIGAKTHPDAYPAVWGPRPPSLSI